ncbi:class I SAM-dependent methyltransferase [Azoarcus sp. L1K30]|uniref:class I SAM-dependent methyltransferase n=1 Tax=Azoarcus sp. L1K30 TaxID=2820277 RepID=UPI001B833582|nr:class I SAM-dependent methyltransferase [Azoarcus sp. L1K30]MBR0568589.1 class I SAM-dependent methyltransferase [Azoarcus sp. L1K30]
MNMPLEVEIEDCSCPLGCGRNDQVVLDHVTDRLHGLPGEYRIVRCRNCGLMRTNPRPTAATIAYYYPSNYAPHRNDAHRASVAGRVEPYWKRVLTDLIDERDTLMPDVKRGRALEFGCASGGFLARLRDSGWLADGIEPNHDAAARARAAGFAVHVGQIEDAPVPGVRYDLVVGWMVMEHLHHPIDALRKLHEWSNPDALLAISVPDCGTWEFSLFKDKWFGLQVPTHLFHFTRASLTEVLRRGGWEVERIFSQRVVYPVRESVNYVLRDSREIGALSRTGLRLVSRALVNGWVGRPLGVILAAAKQTGCMTVLARRISVASPN